MPDDKNAQDYFRDLREWLRKEIQPAARKAFDSLRKKYPKEQFYVFSLACMTDCDGVVASAQTEEGYQRIVKKRQKNDNFEQYRMLYRWWWPEWGNTVDEKEYFGNIYDRVNDKKHKDFIKVDEDLRWPMHRASFSVGMTLSLFDLDNEGYFGKEKEREKVAIFCSQNDMVEVFEYQSALFLNPKPVFDRLAKEYRETWEGRHQTITKHLKNPSPSDQLYERYLQGKDPNEKEVNKLLHGK